MSERIHAPIWRTSPIGEKSDEACEELGQLMAELPECHFNDVRFTEGSIACSGDESLCCRGGAWIQGSCDPVNP